jgi:hypothetical protein
VSDTVDISGIDKAELLAALFNRSKQQGMGFLDARGDGPMSIATAREVLASGGTRFDYLFGRVMKVDIGGDTLRVGLYDRDVGVGSAAGVVAKLRAKLAV